MFIFVKALPVRCGDCFLISYLSSESQSTQHILIDAGYSNTYHRALKLIIKELNEKGKIVDLFVLTHTDGDHIGGTRPLLADFGVSWFKQAWFNYAPTPYTIKEESDQISIRQGITLRDQLLQENKVNIRPILTGYQQKVGIGIITVVSPNEAQFGSLLEEWHKEEPYPTDDAISAAETDHNLTIANLITKKYEPDSSLSNRSSIAFILQVGALKMLFTGDAHADVIVSSLNAQGYSPANPIQLQLMKVAHHGSKGNTSDELLSYIDCQHYLISSNANNKHQFPHKEALARIIWATNVRRPYEPIHLYFTYNNLILRNMFTLQELKDFNLVCHYPNTEMEGITITYSTDE